MDSALDVSLGHIGGGSEKPGVVGRHGGDRENGVL